MTPSTSKALLASAGLVLAILGAGCVGGELSESAAPAGRAATQANADPTDTHQPFRYLDRALIWVVNQSQCAVLAGNHRLGHFDVDSYSAAQVLATMKADDRARGCTQRVYGGSSAEGVAAFKALIFNEKFYANEFETNCPGTMAMTNAALVDLLDSPATIGVFASTWNPTGTDSESCYYFRFYLLREDGSMAHFYYDYGD